MTSHNEVQLMNITPDIDDVNMLHLIDYFLVFH